MWSNRTPIQRKGSSTEQSSKCIDKDGVAAAFVWDQIIEADGGRDTGTGQTTSGENQSGTHHAQKNQPRDKYDASRADAKETHGMLLTLDKGLKRRADLNSLL